MKAFKKFPFFIILIQLLIVTFLSFKVYDKQKNVLGTFINPISKESLLFPEDGKYKYFYEHNPDSIATLSSSLIKNLGYPKDTTIRYLINLDGLNQITNYSIKKPKGIYRIITLGDSYTFGQSVNTEDNYPSRLEKKLNENLKCKNISGFQVLNLGMEGYDISYAVERYRIRGQKYNPDLLLWFILDTDLLRIDELQIPKAKYFDSVLEESGKEEILNRQGVFFEGWHKANDEILNMLGGEDNILKMQRKYFSDISKYYEGPLLIFNFPSVKKKYFDVLNDFKNSRKNTYLYSNLVNIYNHPEYYLKDLHPSAKGYSSIVEDLYDYLINNKIIPCEKS